MDCDVRPTSLCTVRVANNEDQLVTRLTQPLHQRAADHPGRSRHQDAHDEPRTGIARWLGRTFVSGAAASILSTIAVSLHSRARTGHATSGVNATSHWAWGERAMWHHRPDISNTVLGYAIHHASSMWWAGMFELTAYRRPPRTVAGVAAATAVTAYVVDYHLVPRRLTPGFDRHISGVGMVSAYVAFGVGLAAAHLILRRAQHRSPRSPRVR